MSTHVRSYKYVICENLHRCHILFISSNLVHFFILCSFPAVLHRFNVLFIPIDCIIFKETICKKYRFYSGMSFLNSPYILRTQARAWLPDDAVVSPVLSLDSSSSFIFSILLLAPLSLNDPVTCSLSVIAVKPVLTKRPLKKKTKNWFSRPIIA